MTAAAPRPKTLPIAVALFAAGVLALVVVFGLFAAGYTEMPLWLSVAACLLTPVGLAMAVLSVVRDSRRQR
jgi:hypothetical protein